MKEAVSELSGTTKKYSGFYYSGNVGKLIEAFDGNKSILRFCGGDSGDPNLISLQAFEDVLVSKFADLVLAATPTQDLAAYWHVARVCAIQLKSTSLYHNLSPFPLLHTGIGTLSFVVSACVARSGTHPLVCVRVFARIGTTFDLVTNIDRNALYPSYIHFDGLVVALLSKLSQQMKPEQHWATLVLDQYLIKARLKSGFV